MKNLGSGDHCAHFVTFIFPSLSNAFLFQQQNMKMVKPEAEKNNRGKERLEGRNAGKQRS